MVSKDFGATISRLVYRGNKFLLSNGYFFVAKVKDAVKQTVTLLISTDGGSSFSVSIIGGVISFCCLVKTLGTERGAIDTCTVLRVWGMLKISYICV